MKKPKQICQRETDQDTKKNHLNYINSRSMQKRKSIHKPTMTGLILLFLGSLILFLLMPHPSFAAPAASPVSIGQVVWVKGSVKATSEGKTRDLQRRAPIYNQDTIVTDKTSTGQIVFTDNSLIALRADTTLKIDNYKFDKAKGKDSKFVASLVKGGFRTVTGLIPKQNANNYQVNTPVATISVRGTSYNILMGKQFYLQFLEGRPCVTNVKGSFCLDEKNRFVEVKDANSAPMRLAQDPGVFKGQPDIVPASFSSGPISPGSMTPGGGTGGGSLTPKGNSFCIQ